MFDALICIKNHIIASINYILSQALRDYFSLWKVFFSLQTLKFPIRWWFNLRGGGGELGLCIILIFLLSISKFTKIRRLLTHFLSSRCTIYYYTGWGT